MNIQLLKYVIAKNGETAGDLAKFLDMSLTTLSKKMNENGSQFKQKEIGMIAGRYKLTKEEITDIFFADNVS